MWSYCFGQSNLNAVSPDVAPSRLNQAVTSSIRQILMNDFAPNSPPSEIVQSSRRIVDLMEEAEHRSVATMRSRSPPVYGDRSPPPPRNNHHITVTTTVIVDGKKVHCMTWEPEDGLYGLTTPQRTATRAPFVWQAPEEQRITVLDGLVVPSQSQRVRLHVVPRDDDTAVHPPVAASSRKNCSAGCHLGAAGRLSPVGTPPAPPSEDALSIRTLSPWSFTARDVDRDYYIITVSPPPQEGNMVQQRYIGGGENVAICDPSPNWSPLPSPPNYTLIHRTFAMKPRDSIPSVLDDEQSRPQLPAFPCSGGEDEVELERVEEEVEEAPVREESDEHGAEKEHLKYDANCESTVEGNPSAVGVSSTNDDGGDSGPSTDSIGVEETGNVVEVRLSSATRAITLDSSDDHQRRGGDAIVVGSIGESAERSALSRSLSDVAATGPFRWVRRASAGPAVWPSAESKDDDRPWGLFRKLRSDFARVYERAIGGGDSASASSTTPVVDPEAEEERAPSQEGALRSTGTSNCSAHSHRAAAAIKGSVKCPEDLIDDDADVAESSKPYRFAISWGHSKESGRTVDIVRGSTKERHMDKVSQSSGLTGYSVPQEFPPEIFGRIHRGALKSDPIPAAVGDDAYMDPLDVLNAFPLSLEASTPEADVWFEDVQEAFDDEEAHRAKLSTAYRKSVSHECESPLVPFATNGSAFPPNHYSEAIIVLEGSVHRKSASYFVLARGKDEVFGVSLRGVLQRRLKRSNLRRQHEFGEKEDEALAWVVAEHLYWMSPGHRVWVVSRQIGDSEKCAVFRRPALEEGRSQSSLRCGRCCNTTLPEYIDELNSEHDLKLTLKRTSKLPLALCGWQSMDKFV